MGAKNLASPEEQDWQNLLNEVSEVVHHLSGIQLGPKQRRMVDSRLRVHLLRLGIETPEEYRKFRKAHLEQENQALLSMLTTHHTYFFREFIHFEHLLTSGLAETIASVRSRGEKKLRVWSAAASRGQEVYTLAMFLDAHLKLMAPDMDYEILGTDVDPESVKIAANGVYPYKELKEVPAMYLEGNWTKGTGEIADFVKVKKHLRERCSFQPNNLLKMDPSLRGKKFDWIFCRNVFIYFNSDQINSICHSLLACLQPQGRLFVGVSESLSGLPLPIRSVGPSVYTAKDSSAETTATRSLSDAKSRTSTSSQPHSSKVVPGGISGTKSATAEPVGKPAVAVPVANAPAQTEASRPLRVVCVDDSPTILLILNKMLVKEFGFEVVGTAKNGLEAAQLMQKTQADVMTLDIHMPELDGIGYLQKHHTTNHVPVVMVSTVARENADLALKALSLGAVDYVEKPSMQEMEGRGEEIRMKLRMAHLARSFKSAARPAPSPGGSTSVQASFAKSFVLPDASKKTLLVTASFSQRPVILDLIKAHKKEDPALVFVLLGAGAVLEAFVADLEKQVGRKLSMVSSLPQPAGSVGFAHSAELEKGPLTKMSEHFQIIGLAMAPPPDSWVALSTKLKLRWIWEDVFSGKIPKKWAGLVVDQMPSTSFASRAIEIWSEKK